MPQVVKKVSRGTMYTIDKKGNAYSLIDVSASGAHNGSATRHKRESFAFCRYSIETYGYVSHWVFGTDYIGEAGLNMLKRAAGKIQRYLNKLGAAYIMTFEEGEKSKHWHIHTLIDRYINILDVRNIWIKATGILGVHVNVTTIEPSDDVRSSNVRLAEYINKSVVKSISAYINKCRSCYPGERFFRKSQNVNTLIRPFLDQEKPKDVKLFLGVACVADDPFYNAVRTIASMSGYDEAEVMRRLLADD